MSANPDKDMRYYQERPKKGTVEFIVSDRAKEIMERRPNATLDEVIKKP